MPNPISLEENRHARIGTDSGLSEIDSNSTGASAVLCLGYYRFWLALGTHLQQPKLLVKWGRCRYCLLLCSAHTPYYSVQVLVKFLRTPYLSCFQPHGATSMTPYFGAASDTRTLTAPIVLPATQPGAISTSYMHYMRTYIPSKVHCIHTAHTTPTPPSNAATSASDAG